MKEERSPCWREDQLGHRGSFGASEESMVASVQRASREVLHGWAAGLAHPSLKRSY